MKLALIQLRSKPGDAHANRCRAEAAICEAAGCGADLVVLPEAWNLGFFPKEQLEWLAEPDGGGSRRMLQALAEELDIHIVGGSVIAEKGGGVYNTAYVFNRNGQLVAEYDKIHSISSFGEHLYFQSGSAPCIFALDGVKMGLMICYDLQFCELARTLALSGAQILFVPAQWPAARLDHWLTLNRARAIENQMFVAAVNGCSEACGTFSGGHSLLLSPLGEPLAGAGSGQTTVYGEIDLDTVAQTRERLGVLRDRRPELYGMVAERDAQ